jgi:transposase
MKLQAETIWLAMQPVDMRIGVDGLSLHVQQALGHAACDGNAYVFSNRRHTRLKVVRWDGNGVWLCQRRLHRASSSGRKQATPLGH